MSLDPFFWLAAAGLLATLAAAIAVRSLAEFAPHELKKICRRGKTEDRLGQILRHRERVALAAETLQVLGSAVFVAAVALRMWAGSQAGEPPSAMDMLFGAIVAAVALLVAEVWIPRAVAHLWAAPLLYHTWTAWQTLGLLLAPLVLGARFVDAVLHRLAGRPGAAGGEEAFEEDIRTIVTEGHREGLLEEDAREMIEGVIELGDLDVSEVMAPRTDMICMSHALSWEEALQFVINAGHSRIPVYKKNRDDIVGILYSKDLLPELAKKAGEAVRPWTALLREPYFVPETKPIDALLQEFQRSRNHMAVVLDEYGGVSGLVTIEDVLEEIVGEIVDEYDPDLVEGMRPLEDGSMEALGRVRIDEINQRLGLELPEDADYDTIGGFVFSQLGRIPAVGEEVLYKRARVTVLEATPRRIERVRIEIVDHPQAETV